MANKPAITISIEGIDEVKEFLKDKQSAFTQAAEKAVAQSLGHLQGEVTQSIAGNRAETRSVDTGNLMRSIRWTQNGMEGEVFTEVEYAPYIEYGTSRRPVPRDHFRNTAAREAPKVQRFIDNEIKAASK